MLKIITIVTPDHCKMLRDFWRYIWSQLSRTQISHGHTEGRSGKVRFRACSVPARPEIWAFLSLRMFVLSVVTLGDFAE